jgi:hypothetical protein
MSSRVERFMSLRETLFVTLIRFSFHFERFFPYIIRMYINRKLATYQHDGRLSNYFVKAQRRDRYHYIFQIDLLLDQHNLREVIRRYELAS